MLRLLLQVEALGKVMISLQANVNYHNVAMGQGQEPMGREPQPRRTTKNPWRMGGEFFPNENHMADGCVRDLHQLASL